MNQETEMILFMYVFEKKKNRTPDRIETSVATHFRVLYKLFLTIAAHCPRMVEYFPIFGPLFSILFVKVFGIYR